MLSKLFKAMSIDNILAIFPDFADKVDSTEEDATLADAKAKAQIEAATIIKKKAERQLRAVSSFRKATGGKE